MKALTTESILKFGNRGFFVSYRWRDEGLMRRCEALVKEGRMRREKTRGGINFYTLKGGEHLESGLANPQIRADADPLGNP